MAKGDMVNKVGSWAFIIGFLVAVVLGVLNMTQAWVFGLLLVLGLIVGLLNITSSEITPLLVACVALLVAAPALSLAVQAAGLESWLGWLARTLTLVSVFVIPAAVIAALKAIFALAQND